MIIWINGAFGSGKTTTAYELQRRLPNSYVYDPENIGFFLHKNSPRSIRKPDFQDHEQWRSFNYEMLKWISSRYNGTLIVPMTLVNRTYYEEIIQRVREDGTELKHYILYAARETLIRRQRKRLEGKNGWARKQIDRCLFAYDNEITEEKIITDTMTVDEVVEEIARRAEVNLAPDLRSRWRKGIDRLKVAVAHIR